MPRPKRTKVTSLKEAPQPAPTSAPKVNMSVANVSHETATNSEAATIAQNEVHASGHESDVSLASQGLKIASRRVVSRKSQTGYGFQTKDTNISGALRTGDKDEGAVNLTDIKTKGRAAPVTNMQPRNGRTRQRRVIKRATEDDKVLEELKKRRDAALQAEKDSATMVPNTQTSGEVADQEAETGEGTESTLTLKDTTEDLSNGAVIVPSTPAVEASVVAIANFKRRPRQPSILRMVQQQHQHQQNQDSSQEDSVDAAGDSEILGISEPEDESTPLPNQAATRVTSEHALRSSSSRKRKASDAVEGSETRTPRSSPPVIQTSPTTAAERPSTLHSDSPSLPDPVNIARSVRRRTGDTALDTSVTESQAPPYSSSGEESGPETPQREERLRAKQRKTRAKSPEVKESTTAKKQVLTTAQLRNMLPRRHHRNAADRSSPFEIHSSSSTTLELHNSGHDNSDFDELTLAKSQRFHKHRKHNRNKTDLPTTHLRRTYSQQHLSSDKENESASEEADDRSDEDDTDSGTEDDTDPKDGNFRGGRTQRKASKNKSAARKKQPNKANKAKSKALQELDQQKRQQKQQKQHQPSAELQSIAMKFREIDNWEMSFENVDVDAGVEGGTGSSPWR